MLRRLVANWELKILSVVIAFALWLVVVGSGKSQLATPAIVEYTGLGADLVLVGRPRDSVQVELEASRWAVARLTPGAVRARVSVAGMHEGENVAALSPELVEAPPGVTVRRVTPNRLPVTLAAAVAKTLQVVPQIRGAPEPDHVIHRVTVEPSTVQVKGPRSTIEGRTSGRCRSPSRSRRRGRCVGHEGRGRAGDAPVRHRWHSGRRQRGPAHA